MLLAQARPTMINHHTSRIVCGLSFRSAVSIGRVGESSVVQFSRWSQIGRIEPQLVSVARRRRNFLSTARKIGELNSIFILV